ncbi:hypothetical protein HII36_22300 [Nonomuraea sp. NN258]|uniref:hypothetical protein n=1 Tax=Nonomuraea antri TaxID=2730852 RepID=UPI001568397D|nr:hypothetical protein [Nonomuraea antri]NRQ34551.1 hypothetical protein [Nonomuraea antri]
MLPELSQLSGCLPIIHVSSNDLLLQLVFEVVPDRGPQESAKVALTKLGESVACQLEARGREMAGPKRMEIHYFCRPDGQWMACLPDEATYGAACIRVMTRPLTQAVEPSVDVAALPTKYQLRLRQLGLPALEPP